MAKVGYIRATYERLFSLEAENKKYHIPCHGIRNLSCFCENLMFNVKEVQNAIHAAMQRDEDYCNYGDWTFYWMTIDQWRDMINKKSKNKIDLDIRRIRIHGKVPLYVEDFAKCDRRFANGLAAFMEKR